MIWFILFDILLCITAFTIGWIVGRVHRNDKERRKF